MHTHAPPSHLAPLSHAPHTHTHPAPQEAARTLDADLSSMRGRLAAVQGSLRSKDGEISKLLQLLNRNKDNEHELTAQQLQVCVWRGAGYGGEEWAKAWRCRAMAMLPRTASLGCMLGGASACSACAAG